MSTAIGTLIAVVGLWLSLAFLCCSGGSLDPQPHQIKYEVVGNGTSAADVTYSNAQGGTQQEKIRLPWSKSLQASGGTFLYVSSQNQEEYGGLEVTIWVDGKEWKRSTSNGGFTIASASGSCCY